MYYKHSFRLYCFLLSFILGIGSLVQVNAQGFSGIEYMLIYQKSEQEPFDVVKTTAEGGEEFLRTPSIDIDAFGDSALYVLSRRMLATVQNPDNDGVGIAAPQIGLHRNAIWVQRFDKEGEPFEFYVNLKILWLSDLLQLGREGCLSIPELYGEVYRSYAVTIQYQTLEGHTRVETVEGFTAVIFQHEYDHILGILFPDRIQSQEKNVYKKVDNHYRLDNAKR